MESGIMATVYRCGHGVVEISIRQKLTLSEFGMVLNSALEMPGITYFTFRELGKKMSWGELASRNSWPALYSRIRRVLRPIEAAKWSMN